MMKTKRFFALLLALALLFATASAQELASGAKGDAVEQLQNRLYYLGFLSITPDGDYGPKTVCLFPALPGCCTMLQNPLFWKKTAICTDTMRKVKLFPEK